jgi:hypothetical protein
MSFDMNKLIRRAESIRRNDKEYLDKYDWEYEMELGKKRKEYIENWCKD